MKYTYHKKAKLVGKMGGDKLWLLNLRDDWIHDQYAESYIYYGTIYTKGAPFPQLSTSITGYFQDSDSQKWIEVQEGIASFIPGEVDKAWIDATEGIEFGWKKRCKYVLQKSY